MLSSGRYEQFLRRYDARPAEGPGAGRRRRALLDVLAGEAAERVELLDVASGGAVLREARALFGPMIDGAGVVLSETARYRAGELCPGSRFRWLDLLAPDAADLALLAADYVVIDDLFLDKCGLGDTEMWGLLTATLERLWPLARKALAFSIAAPGTGRQADGRFAVSLDRLTEFLGRLTGRRFVLRADDGFDEYVCTVRTQLPSAAAPPADGRMVLRPLLPDATALLPYLREIDRRRWYSNFGALHGVLTARLARHFGLDAAQSTAAGSGTAALAAALIAAAGRGGAERPYCLMPSYTFVGTVAAALDAGYRPYFVDVDPVSWALDPERLRHHPMLAETGAIVAVAPYGRPIAQRAWQELSAATGVPVVIDAAAGFDAIAAAPAATLGKLPVVLSLHATKVFGLGEGGLILCSDADLVGRAAAAANFGFRGSREAMLAGSNGKLSEYHAAVGLAALDRWPGTRAGFVGAAAGYREAARRCGIDPRIIAETGWACGYVLYRAESAAEAEAARQRLDRAGIDWRLWYGLGCHRQPAYTGCRRDPMPVTDELAPRLIGLPVAVDLAQPVIEEIVAVLARG